jgi:hypothetical protein
MSKTLRFTSALLMLGGAVGGWSAGCSSSGGGGGGGKDAGPTPDASQVTPEGGGGGQGDGGDASAALTYVIIDDMESTTHGPILLPGITAPETPGYWFNFGASKLPEAGPPPDMADPPIMSFTFTALPSPTTTLNGKTSSHAAHQSCSLNKLYDVCGVGMEFAQVNAPDAGDASFVDASGDGGDGGDGGPSIPKVTIPFDISRYKGITFWGRSTSSTDDAATGATIVKVLFPNTFTDPRGGVCNGAAAGASGPDDTSQCYNSFALSFPFTSEWQQFTLMFNDPNLTISSTFGYQFTADDGGPPQFTGKDIYGINWQAQDNAMPDSNGVPTDLWVDDVYFIE